jgi:hypothetical protein
LPVVDRLQRRFSIGRICIVADRGMISAETIAGVEARGLLYILGVRERSDKLVREVVLADDAPFVPLIVEKRKQETEYGAKTVKLNNQRYIVCINHQEAQKDAADRRSILESLERQLKKGDKALVGNTGYRRFLATVGDGHFAIDHGKAEEDKKFDGIFVLRTNTDLNPLQAMLRYKQLWTVDIDQAWGLSRLCCGMIWGDRPRQAPPRLRRRANLLKLGDGRGVGVKQFDGRAANRNLAAA